ncbi:MAG: hypothetical protein AB7O04_14050 [Hyphomonadaceae bacterium]
MAFAEPDLSEELVRKLKAAARTTGALAAAQVQYLNVSDLAARSGRHWPAVNERIRSGSLSFIRACVDADDLVIPCDDGFLILFTEGDSAHHAERAQELQSMLGAFYFGEEGLETLQVQVDPRQLNGDDVRAFVSNNRSGGKAIAEPGTCAHEGAHDIAFWPVWAAQAELIALHFCAPNYCDHGVVRHGYDRDFRLSGRHSSADFAHLDLTILQSASAALARLLTRSPGSVVGATVHVTTLRRRQALGEYLRTLQAIPESTRQRMVVKIAEIEPGTPTGSLAEWASLLRQHVRHVGLGFHPSERAFERFRNVGAWSVGIELPSHGLAPSADTKRPLNTLIERWTRAARPVGPRLHIEGFRSMELLATAKRNGLNFASSEIAWPPLRQPSDIMSARLPVRNAPGA